MRLGGIWLLLSGRTKSSRPSTCSCATFPVDIASMKGTRGIRANRCDGLVPLDLLIPLNFRLEPIVRPQQRTERQHNVSTTPPRLRRNERICRQQSYQVNDGMPSQLGPAVAASSSQCHTQLQQRSQQPAQAESYMADRGRLPR